MPQSNGPRKEPRPGTAGASAGDATGAKSSGKPSAKPSASAPRASSGKAASKASASSAPASSKSASGKGTSSKTAPSKATSSPRPPRDTAGPRRPQQTGGQGVGGWLRSLRVSGFSVLLIGILILGVIVLAPNLKTFIEQRQQIASLQLDVQRTKAQVDELTKERARWNDQTYVMTQARERLFYALPGEVSYIVINDLDPASIPAGKEPVSDGLVATKSDWLHGLLSSIVATGFSPAPEHTKAPSGTPADAPTDAPKAP
ncbi:FtsB family cell division protein [Plantibacter sp. Mn2098]|uniref:FtsB family cell division protein n=1 Tax=Plantibacter sp. Mn2098 TaxID=3395266 RepID=UPI003BD78C1E